MKIAIGCDHGGINLKGEVIEGILETGNTYVDFGCYDDNSVDYPEYAAKVARAVVSGEYDRGILLCGTGIGMSIAANKIKGIRCGHVTDVFSATATREHNNANVIAMGGRISTPEQAKAMTIAYLNAEYAGGRHERRVSQITALEEN